MMVRWYIQWQTMQTSMTASYSEIISQRPSRWDRALRDSGSAIHMGCSMLEHAMEVQARTLIPQLVVDVDDQSITNVAFDDGDRPTTIDANGWSFKLSSRIR